jgi:predicted metal-dependent hydrolase
LPTIELGEHRIEYSIIKGRSRHYTYFRFRPDRTLEIVLPRGRTGDLESVIRSRSRWIVRNYLKMSNENRVFDGRTIMFNGVHLNVTFEESHEVEEIQPEQSRGEVVIRARDRSRTRELIRRWFLNETSKYVVRRVAELSQELQLDYKAVDVRKVKSWGYCTKSGRLSFSWQLIALPERLREYVILHELSHLVEFNHSAAFKVKLAAVCPDYRQREKELDRIVVM